jgi:hypothetical protein
LDKILLPQMPFAIGEHRYVRGGENYIQTAGKPQRSEGVDLVLRLTV